MPQGFRAGPRVTWARHSPFLRTHNLAATSPTLEQPATQKATLVLNQATQRELIAVLQACSLPSISEVLRSCLLLSLEEPTVKKELKHNLLLTHPTKASSGSHSPRKKKAVA